MMNITQAYEYLRLHSPKYAKLTTIENTNGVQSFDFVIPRVKLNDPKNMFKKKDAVFTFSDDGSGTVLFLEQTGADFDIEDENDIKDLVLSYVNSKDLRNMNESKKMNEGRITPEMMYKDNKYKKVGAGIYKALMLAPSKKSDDLVMILEAFAEGIREKGTGYMMNFTFLNEGKVKQAYEDYKKAVKKLLKNDKIFAKSEFQEHMAVCFKYNIPPKECIDDFK